MNEFPLGILFFLLLILILLSAFFSGSETALMTLNRYRLQHLVKQKHKGAIITHKLLQRTDRLLGLILLGNNFVNILASSIVTIIAIELGGESAIPIAAGILTFVILIFSEVTPKTFASIKPETLAFSSAWIYLPLSKLFYPMVWVINAIANAILKYIGIDVAQRNADTLSKDEFKAIVSETGSFIPERYQGMLMSIIDLESATIEDIMTPRNEVIGIDIEDPLEKIIEQIHASKHTRMPVFNKSIDKMIGMIHMREILLLINTGNFTKQIFSEALAKPYFVPETTPLHIQMQNFKTQMFRMAIVVDEYGDVLGLVTMEDLVEGIVGEMTTSSSDVKKLSDGSFLVDGSITIRELNRINHWTLPTEGPKTLNGLVIEYLEMIPPARTCMKLYGYPVEVIEVDKNTVKLVKFYSM